MGRERQMEIYIFNLSYNPYKDGSNIIGGYRAVSYKSHQFQVIGNGYPGSLFL
jgi:hypothetical protein